MNAGFGAGEQRWMAHLDNLRNVVRQGLVARQLRAELPGPPGRVLDLGCGQGTQALELARRGCHVTGLDSSSDLLERFRDIMAAEPPEVRNRVRLVPADIGQVREVLPGEDFDVVLCHGVLMYFADPGPVLDVLANVVAADGVVSLLVRNGDALAMRPGLLGDWDTARHAFDSLSYVNRLGVPARADRLDDLRPSMAERGLRVRCWYGVRIFTDPAPSDTEVPEDAELATILAVEERAGRTDPYRQVAALMHVIADRVV